MFGFLNKIPPFPSLLVHVQLRRKLRCMEAKFEFQIEMQPIKTRLGG